MSAHDERAGAWLAGELPDDAVLPDDELRALRALADRIARIDPEVLNTPVPPPSAALRGRVLDAVDPPGPAAPVVPITSVTPRRWRGRVLAVAAAVVVLVAAAGLLTRSDDDEPELAALEVVDPRPGLEPAGRFAVAPSDGGSEVTLEVEGLADGQTYVVWLAPPPEEGGRVRIGDFAGSPSDTLTFRTTFPAADAARIWITDGEGTVLAAPVAPGSD